MNKKILKNNTSIKKITNFCDILNNYKSGIGIQDNYYVLGNGSNDKFSYGFYNGDGFGFGAEYGNILNYNNNKFQVIE